MRLRSFSRLAVALVALALDAKDPLRAEAIDVLAQLGPAQESVDALLLAAQDTDPKVRAAALRGLGRLEPASAKVQVTLVKALRDPNADLESYVAIHQGVIFGVLVLVTGSIWAKYSWGHWWLWSENQLVLFLVLFLFYSAYFMLRFSLEPGPARENMCAVYALFGVVLIPVSFLAIRLSANFIHPVVFTQRGPQMAPSMLLVFVLSLLGMLSLAATLYAFEVGGKLLDRRLRELKTKYDPRNFFRMNHNIKPS